MNLTNYFSTLKISLLKENLFTNKNIDKEALLKDTLSLLDLKKETKDLLKPILKYEDRYVFNNEGQKLLPVTFLCGKVLESGINAVLGLNKSSRDIQKLLQTSSVEELVKLFKKESDLDLMIATGKMEIYIKTYISILFQENPLLAPMLSKVFLDSFDSKKIVTKDLKTLFDKLTDFFYEDSFTQEDIARSVGIYLYELTQDREYVSSVIKEVFNTEIKCDRFKKGTYYLKATPHPLYILETDQEKKVEQIQITIDFLQKEIFPQFKIAILKSDIIKKGMIRNYYNLFNNILEKDRKEYLGDNPTTSYIKKSLKENDPFLEVEGFSALFFN